MRIVVSKSPAVVVRPSEPVTPATRKINLSPFDKPFSIIPINVLLAFDHSINEPVEIIRKSLSQALVHYYPIAGRFAGDDYNDLHIDYTGNDDEGGVTFVAASADCTINDLLRDIDGRSPDPSTALLHELLVDYPASMMSFSHADPLLLMQVTAFSCGGFVIGVTWNHGIADGFGIAQFLQAVGDLTRGMPAPAVVPVRWDTSTQQVTGYESVLFLTCWRNIGFERVDFGCGGEGTTPMRVMTVHKQSLVRPTCVVCLPCKCEEGGGGARVLSSCVTAHHSDAFLREIATL
uniref:Uncharacterized protein n=1 Tax=Leersia perrieri TaxID=77586 RepID=A0A0D9XHF3_9ORYZ